MLSCVNETIPGRGLQLVLKIVLLQLNVLFKKFSNAETFIISKIALSIVEEWTQKKSFYNWGNPCIKVLLYKILQFYIPTKDFRDHLFDCIVLKIQRKR